MDPLVGLALVLVFIGFIGSFVPMVPGALISLAGISVYWWSSGFSQPHILVVILLYLTGLTALFFDLFAGAIGSKAGGASNSTVQASAVAGILFFFIGGPLGTITGITLVVYFREYLLTEDSEKSMKAAFYTTASMLGSALIQGFLTGIMLVILVATLLI